VGLVDNAKRLLEADNLEMKILPDEEGTAGKIFQIALRSVIPSSVADKKLYAFHAEWLIDSSLSRVGPDCYRKSSTFVISELPFVHLVSAEPVYGSGPSTTEHISEIQLGYVIRKDGAANDSGDEQVFLERFPLDFLAIYAPHVAREVDAHGGSFNGTKYCADEANAAETNGKSAPSKSKIPDASSLFEELKSSLGNAGIQEDKYEMRLWEVDELNQVFGMSDTQKPATTNIPTFEASELTAVNSFSQMTQQLRFFEAFNKYGVVVE